jgi:hypothetical protein
MQDEYGAGTPCQAQERTKTYIVAPPDQLRVNEKHLREYYIVNCVGIIITTNYQTDGVHLNGR